MKYLKIIIHGCNFTYSNDKARKERGGAASPTLMTKVGNSGVGGRGNIRIYFNLGMDEATYHVV